MKLFNNRKADEEKVEEEIISMVNEGNEQGLIHDDEVEMITNIFEFSEKEVRDVMTPRSDVVGIDKLDLLAIYLDPELLYSSESHVSTVLLRISYRSLSQRSVS